MGHNCRLKISEALLQLKGSHASWKSQKILENYLKVLKNNFMILKMCLNV
jgi:hypothetical protein